MLRLLKSWFLPSPPQTKPKTIEKSVVEIRGWQKILELSVRILKNMRPRMSVRESIEY